MNVKIILAVGEHETDEDDDEQSYFVTLFSREAMVTYSNPREIIIPDHVKKEILKQVSDSIAYINKDALLTGGLNKLKKEVTRGNGS